jgi:hypothetical protein
MNATHKIQIVAGTFVDFLGANGEIGQTCLADYLAVQARRHAGGGWTYEQDNLRFFVKPNRAVVWS